MTLDNKVRPTPVIPYFIITFVETLPSLNSSNVSERKDRESYGTRTNYITGHLRPHTVKNV